MPVANCIECDAEIALSDRPRLGQKLVCPHCHAQLEIVSTNPVELDWAYEDEGWDDEGEDFSDEEADFEDDFDDDDGFEDDDFDDTDEDKGEERWR